MIADGSYHRLLQLDWIRADVDGDGRREYVPHADQTGARPPERSYELFATGSPTAEPGATRRFYFGGNIYEGWSTVPERYKAPSFSRPEPGRNTVRIFPPSRGSERGSSAPVSRDPVEDLGPRRFRERHSPQRRFQAVSTAEQGLPRNEDGTPSTFFMMLW